MLNLIVFFIITLFQAMAEGIYEPNVMWSKTNIRVCFAETEWFKGKTLQELDQIDLAYTLIHFKQHGLIKNWNEEEKLRIIKTITSEFTEAKTALSFNSFGECDQIQDTDVILVRGNKDQNLHFSALSSLGQNSLFKLDFNSFLFPPASSYERSSIDRKSLVIFTLDEVEHLEPIILHEFGHLAGLRHEHIHPKAVFDSNCSTNGTEWLRNERPSTSSIIYTDYDSKSIMNYCWLDYITKIDTSQEVKLSKKDIKTIFDNYKQLNK